MTQLNGPGDDEAKVRDLLGLAFEVDPPASARPTYEGVRAAHRRRRVVGSAGSAGLVTVVVLAATLLPSLGKGFPSATPAGTQAPAVGTHAPSAAPQLTTAPSAQGGSPSPSSDVALPPVLSDGDTVAASGRVVSVPGKPVRLCGPEVNDLLLVVPPPPPAWCSSGVDVTGVDLARLSMRREKAGAIEGYAYLRGTYRSGTMAVMLQASPRYENAPVQNLTDPPCRKPAGGWTKVGMESNPDAAETTLQKYTDAHPGTIVTTAVFRPTPTSAVLVLAAEHPDLVRAALPNDPRAFCVIQSRYTLAQVTAARAPWEADVRQNAGKTGGLISSIGEGVGPDGQATVNAEVLMMTPVVQAWLTAGPAGLVRANPWLKPVASDAPLPPPQPSGAPSPVVTATG